MNSIYLAACGIAWCKTREPEAGWELIEGLRSADPNLHVVAESMLMVAGEASVALIESALALGILSPKDAAPCMVELMRKAMNRRPASVGSASAMTSLSAS